MKNFLLKHPRITILFVPLIFPVITFLLLFTILKFSGTTDFISLPSVITAISYFAGFFGMTILVLNKGN